MAIPKIEAFLWHDNHVVASSFLAPTHQLYLKNRPDPYVFVIFLLSLLYCRSSSAAAAVHLVFLNLSRCINLNQSRERRRLSAANLQP